MLPYLAEINFIGVGKVSGAAQGRRVSILSPSKYTDPNRLG
jgi:hypothetical protein